MDSRHHLLDELDACRHQYESALEENSQLNSQLEQLVSALNNLPPSNPQDLQESPKFIPEQDTEDWREKLHRFLRQSGCVEESSLFSSGLLSPSSRSGSESVLLSDDGHPTLDFDELSPKVPIRSESRSLKIGQMDERGWESEDAVTRRHVSWSRDSTVSTRSGSFWSSRARVLSSPSIRVTESSLEHFIEAIPPDPLLHMDTLKSEGSSNFDSQLGSPKNAEFIREPSCDGDAFVCEQLNQDSFPKEHSLQSEPVDVVNRYRQMARDFSILKLENEKLKRKAKNDHLKLKNRLVVTLKEFNDYKSRNYGLEVLEAENSTLHAHVNDLEALIRELQTSLQVLQKQEEERLAREASIAANVIKFARIEKPSGHESIASGGKVVVEEDKLMEKIATMELELEVLRSHCCMLARKNISLEQLVIRFKSAARQSSPLVENLFMPLTVCSTQDISKAIPPPSLQLESSLSEAGSRAEFNLSQSSDPAIGNGSQEVLQSENRQLISRLQEQKSFYESNIQTLERRCSHLESKVIRYQETSTDGEVCKHCSVLEAEYESLKMQSELERSVAKTKLEELLGKYLQLQAEFTLERQKSADEMVSAECLVNQLNQFRLYFTKPVDTN